jgi:SAM-dependent methyltransferase
VSAPEDPELRRVARFWEARAREDARRYSVPGGARVDDATWEGSGDAVVEELGDGLGWSPWGAPLALDLGCGAGRITGALSDRAVEVIAVDVSPRMIDEARARTPAGNVEWQVADATRLTGIRSGRVDAALVLGLLPHLPTIKLVAAVLVELGRVLKPGGTVAFDVRSSAPALTLPGEHDLPPYVADHPLWRGVTIDLETTAAVAHQAGLVVERIDGSGTPRSLVLARREEA